jgi:hypothetical protein
MRRLVVASLVALASIAACNDESTPQLPACIDFDADACAPLYEPTYENVFAQTFTMKCATGGSACHANAQALGAAKHGLEFSDAANAHALLLQDLGDATFVHPGDESCGVLTVRLRTDDDAKRMPTGSMLIDTELCSVLQWIANGAMP